MRSGTEFCMRAFIAVEIAAAIREKLAELIEQLRPHGKEVKWVEAQNIHLTLKFLGDVPDDATPRIVELMRGCLAGATPCALTVKGAGAFPNLRRPRVLFACASDAPPTLAGVADRLNQAMAELGVEKEERAFQNHITLGRVREPRPMDRLAAQLEKQADREFGSMRIDRITLIRSELRRQGPIYTPIEAARFEAADAMKLKSFP